MQTRKISLAAFLAVAVLSLSACDKQEDVVPSDPVQPAAPAVPAGMVQSDLDFIARAASAGLAEVEAGHSISEKTASGSVRQFAQTMIADHGAANEELMLIARSKQLQVSMMPDATHQQSLNDLKAAMGSDSDKVYVREFGVKAHQDAVALFERQASRGSDPELKAFAEKTLPVLKTHLEHAQRAAAEMPS